jgi:hypothetical protein
VLIGDGFALEAIAGWGSSGRRADGRDDGAGWRGCGEKRLGDIKLFQLLSDSAQELRAESRLRADELTI